MYQRNGVRTVAVALATALALAACSSQGTPSDSSSAGEASGAPAAVDLTLNLSMQAPSGDLSVTNFTGGDPTIYLAVYDRLVTQAVDGSLVPSIAESFEYSEDNTVLTFKIRAGQTFSNGEALDAAAVVASLEASRQSEAHAAQFATVADISAPDASTVVLTLNTPDASLLYILSGSDGAVGAPSTLGTEDSKLNPVGSGPYILDEAQTTVGSTYVLVKNPDNWNADAYPYSEIDMLVIADPTAVQNAIKTGQIDFASLQSPDLVTQFPEADFTTGQSQPTAVGGLFIVDRAGSVVPALADVRVRQAINYAIDRDTIAEKLLGGTGLATAQVMNPAGGAFDSALDSTYPYDVEKAKALMAEAGFANGFELTMPSTVLSQTFDAVLAQELSDIGITVNYETVPFQDLYAKLYAGAYGMFWLYNGYAGSDAKDVQQVLNGSFNPQASTTPELEGLLATANAASMDEQGAAFGAVNAYFVDQAWFAPVTSATGYWVTSKDVTYTPPVAFGTSLLAWQPAS